MNRMVYRKKKKNKPLKKIFFIVFFITIIFCIYKMPTKANIDIITETFVGQGITENSFSSNAAIAGQMIIDNADGYTTTYTSLNFDKPKTYTEYKQNDGTWQYKSYWGGTMEENGCGITSLSIIASAYGSKMTPDDLREEYYPHLDATEMSKALNDMGIKCTDFYFHDTYISKKYITDWLKTNRPVLVCVDNTTENKWTAASHYMVLLDVDDNGMIYISNPNGRDGENNASGWYKANEIIPYIVKALFIESY